MGTDKQSCSSNAWQAVGSVPFKEYSTQVAELLQCSKRLAGEWASQLGQTPRALLYNVVSLSQVHAEITSFACRDISTHIKKLTCQWKDHTLIAWWNSCHGPMESHTGNVRDIFTHEQFFCSIFLGCILIYALRMQRCKAIDLALMWWCSWDKPLMPFSELESTYLLCAKYPP